MLYAPTFRDYLSRDDNRAVMPTSSTSPRPPAARRRLRLPGPRARVQRAHQAPRGSPARARIDVTDYPEVSDLYLAADAAVVDYSSLRFDFGVTGKPMIFHVPDLQRYQDTRGWLFDFEPTAPGPLASTPTRWSTRLADLDGVRASTPRRTQRSATTTSTSRTARPARASSTRCSCLGATHDRLRARCPSPATVEETAVPLTSGDSCWSWAGRSGTSTMAGALAHSGFYVPDAIEAEESNPAGFFEPRWVNDFHLDLLERADVRPLDSDPDATEAVEPLLADDGRGPAADVAGGPAGPARPAGDQGPPARCGSAGCGSASRRSSAGSRAR